MVPFSAAVTSRDTALGGSKPRTSGSTALPRPQSLPRRFFLLGPQNPTAIGFITVGRQTSVAKWRWWEQESQESVLVGQGMLILILLTPGEPGAVASRSSLPGSWRAVPASFYKLPLDLCNKYFLFSVSMLFPSKRRKMPLTVLQVCCEYVEMDTEKWQSFSSFQVMKIKTSKV